LLETAPRTRAQGSVSVQASGRLLQIDPYVLSTTNEPTCSGIGQRPWGSIAWMLKLAPFVGRALLVVDSPDSQAHTVGMCRLLVHGSIMSVAYNPELEDALAQLPSKLSAGSGVHRDGMTTEIVPQSLRSDDPTHPRDIDLAAPNNSRDEDTLVVDQLAPADGLLRSNERPEGKLHLDPITPRGKASCAVATIRSDSPARMATTLVRASVASSHPGSPRVCVIKWLVVPLIGDAIRDDVAPSQLMPSCLALLVVSVPVTPTSTLRSLRTSNLTFSNGPIRRALGSCSPRASYLRLSTHEGHDLDTPSPERTRLGEHWGRSEQG
jgi:hypothetical protein